MRHTLCSGTSCSKSVRDYHQLIRYRFWYWAIHNIIESIRDLNFGFLDLTSRENFHFGLPQFSTNDLG